MEQAVAASRLSRSWRLLEAGEIRRADLKQWRLTWARRGALRFEKKVRAAKRAARSELSVSRGEWTRHSFAQDPSLLSTKGLVDTLPRVHARDLSLAEFVEGFERPRRPVIIRGLCDGWPAAQQWTPERLLKRFGDHKFKIGSDDDGYAVRLKLKHIWRYFSHPQHGAVDDSPLYIFDGTFANRSGSRLMRRDYTVPSYFSEDLMKFAGEHRRPPYRWFVMGGPRSGTSVHVDPLATSAWNTLLTGHKRWALFPPGTPRELLKPPGVEREAATWFAQVYPRTQRGDWPAARPLDVIQGPGDTMFVPAGWWHAVINLDMTIAVTQNYCSTANFPAVWRRTKRGRPKMSAKWLRVLREARPDLARIADELAAAGNDASGTSSSSSSSRSSSSSSSSGSSSSSSSSSSSDSEGEGEGRRKRVVRAAAPQEGACGQATGGMAS
ncbi:hypothetical protein N2152v2_007090 [Parachlorella kessleri]